MGKIASKFLETDAWNIIEKGFHPEENRVSESIFSVGNEYMGVRGYFDEGYSGDQLQGSYLNGVWSERDIIHAVSYKGLARYWTFMVNSVNWLYTRIRI
ncbi:MAG: family 65 glycosyl hydrolase, partial [Bacteroidales bacterium]|nr:family 65 glycosyl hydrolase [Bacteroidales bacterium]